MTALNLFEDLSVKRTPEPTQLEIYVDDARYLNEYVELKRKALGGEITLADVFHRLIKYLWMDPEFAAKHPTASPPIPLTRGRSRRKGRK